MNKMVVFFFYSLSDYAYMNSVAVLIERRGIQIYKRSKT